MDKQQPEKFNGASLNISAENRARLKQLFPSVFIETKTDQGELVEAIDFAKLKAELGTFSDLFENRRERYGMDWPGKKEALRIIQSPSHATLKPNREESVNFDTTENLYVEGDNLEVLKLLQKSYYGKVKMIYIDPPYNTGKEFIYPDNFTENLQTYLEYAGLVDSDGKKFSTNTANEGRFHTRWLNMMCPRLYLARNLLRDDGVIFISIDDNEVVNLRKLCDEIFGEENFIGNIANINNPKGRSDDKYIAMSHEYLLIYAKNKAATFWLGFEPEDKVIVRYNKSDGKDVYREIDLRKTGDADLQEDRPEMFYYFYYDKDHLNIKVSKEQLIKDDLIEIIPIREDGKLGRWRWGFDTAKDNLDKLICRYMPMRKIWGVFEKDYLKNRSLLKPVSAWQYKDVNSERGSEQFIGLGFGKEIFPKPKPVGTIKRCLLLSTAPSDIIIDLFSGSATTAHAVLDLNNEDGGNRKFIMVQLPEPCAVDSGAFKAGYKTIADIGKERIRRVINKLNDEQEGKLDLENEKAQDRGFRVLKLDRSNFKQWQELPPSTAPEKILEQLELHIDHISHTASQEDLLFEILLKAGFMPTEKAAELKLAGKKVFSVADGALLICLEDTVSKELIDKVAAAEPQQFICLDAAFGGNDQLKANSVQTFAALNMQKETHNQIVFRTV
jgi:adenine-specific DNA-methyltransferase